jgi:hypothetical protein
MIRPIRRAALVGPTELRVAVHTAGYPLDPDRMLPVADVVLVVSQPKGDTMLFRYTAYGEMCGDTPHDSLADAEEQARQEYGHALLEWIDVPTEVKDAHDFAIRYAHERLKSRD